MSEQELYELSEPELRQMLANGERNVEREISRMYDKLAFTVVMLPFIDSFIKKRDDQEIGCHRENANIE